jgi:hypothetical protein
MDLSVVTGVCGCRNRFVSLVGRKRLTGGVVKTIDRSQASQGASSA